MACRGVHELLEASAGLLRHMRDELDHAHHVTGRSLPGPLPHGQVDADPDTGFNTDLENLVLVVEVPNMIGNLMTMIAGNYACS